MEGILLHALYVLHFSNSTTNFRLSSKTVFQNYLLVIFCHVCIHRRDYHLYSPTLLVHFQYSVDFGTEKIDKLIFQNGIFNLVSQATTIYNILCQRFIRNDIGNAG